MHQRKPKVGQRRPNAQNHHGQKQVLEKRGETKSWPRIDRMPCAYCPQPLPPPTVLYPTIQNPRLHLSHLTSRRIGCLTSQRYSQTSRLLNHTTMSTQGRTYVTIPIQPCPTSLFLQTPAVHTNQPIKPINDGASTNYMTNEVANASDTNQRS